MRNKRLPLFIAPETRVAYTTGAVGSGWRLTLAPGYQIVRRAKDYAVERK